MERRSFLKGLVAAPAAASVTKLDAAIPQIKWEPKEYSYGDWGLLEVRIVSSKRHIVEAIATYPENDWINECERQNIFRSGIYESYPCTDSDKTAADPFILAVPVNEITSVQVYADGILVANDIPKSKGKGYIFEPWEFRGLQIIGDIDG